MIAIHFWPYALQMANDMHNSTPKIASTQSPLELFSQVSIKATMRQFHHFGCPVYMLHAASQAGCKTQKWEHQSRMGIYLGMSPQHACLVGLILSLTNCLVSPQFHLSFDDLFETTTKNEKESLLP